MKPVPEYDQRLYRCVDGKLQTVRFIEQVIVGPLITWVVNDPELGRIPCVPSSYFTTPYLAWKAELDNYEQSLKEQRAALKKAQEEIDKTKTTIGYLKSMVTRSIT